MKILLLPIAILCFNIAMYFIARIFQLKRSNALFCGLVGYCGPALPNMSIIKLLMLYNLDRGKDSTGILFDNKITKEMESVDKFLAKRKDFFKQPKAVTETTTFIGHTRSATAGIPKVLRNAHPFCVLSYEDRSPQFYLAMNGSITNMWALNRSYESNYEHNASDSLHLALMLHLYPESLKAILNAYEGAANLLYYNHGEKNTMYVWKDPGRPLHYWKVKGGMYISSMPESLEAAGAEEKDVIEFEDYNLYKIVDGEIVEKNKLREKIVATPSKATTRNYNNYGNNCGDACSVEYPPANGGADDKAPFRTNSGAGTGTKSKNRVEEQQLGLTYGTAQRRTIKYADCIYTCDGIPFTGTVLCDSVGNIFSKLLDGGQSSRFRKKFFIMGHPIANIHKYNSLMEEVGFTEGTTRYVNLEKLNGLLPSDLSKFFLLPIQSRISSSTTYWYKGSPIKETVRIKPPFSRATLEYVPGRKVAFLYKGQEEKAKEYGPVRYSTLNLNPEDWKQQIKDHYLLAHEGSYDMLSNILSDYSLDWEYTAIDDIVHALISLAMDADLVNVATADTLSKHVKEGVSGIAYLNEQGFAALDAVYANLVTLLHSSNVNDVEEIEDVDDQSVTRSSDDDVFNVDLDIKASILTEEVKNPAMAYALDKGKYATAREMVNLLLCPKDMKEQRQAYNNVAYLLHLRMVIPPNDYKNLTDGSIEISKVQHAVESYYATYQKSESAQV